ncbi:MAG: FkbM family methyltransferase [Candidatus Hodarchaeota archaeon]
MKSGNIKKHKEMDNIDLLKLFNKAIFPSKGSRIEILRKNTKKLLLSKILELTAIWLKKSIIIKAKLFWNENMVIAFPELVSTHIFRYGFFEEDLTRMVLEYLKPGMTFFDIGAHFGYFTLLGSFIVGNDGQVHSFEPTPSSFNILKSNVSNRENVILNNQAVFSQPLSILINDYGLRFSAFNSIYDARLPQSILSKLVTKKYEVSCVSIDSYVEHNGAIPNFIKIDAESSEYEVLLGMEKTIAEFHPVISIEVGDMNVKGAPKSKELINFLVNKNYHPCRFKDGKILKQALKKEQYQYNNILFLPG